MKRWLFVLPLFLLSALALVLTEAALAQSPAAIPRTPDGHPDFQGVWERHMATPLERPAGVASLVVPAEEAQRIAAALFDERFKGIGGTPRWIMPGQMLNRVGGEFRTSQVIDPPDGKLPYTAEGFALSARARAALSGATNDPEQRRTQERCIAGSGRAPLSIMPELMFSRFVQTPGYLVIQTEHTADLRVIPLGRVHEPVALTSWRGDSIARWEGETPVVETVNIRDDIQAMVVRRQSRVIEWFTLAAQNELNYRFTVEDPLVYARPWKAVRGVNYSCRSCCLISECYQRNTDHLRGLRQCSPTF